jgi:phage head maturation protease
MSLETINISGSFNVFTKGEGPYIIGGYASFDVVDLQKDKISPQVIGPSFDKMMAIPERRNLMFNHTNIQVGRILPDFIDKTGRTWRSGADNRGLFIVAEIFKDLSISKKLMALMDKGRFLSFSIGGTALNKSKECATIGGKHQCYSNINEMELHEVTVCERGANQYAKGFILEKDIEKALEKMLIETDLAQSNDIFKYNKIEPSLEDLLMSEAKKSDLQIVLDAITDLKKVEIVAPPTPTVAAPAPLSIEQVKEVVAEMLKAAKPAEPVVKEVPVEKTVYVYAKPDESKFTNKDEFAKVLSEYEAFRKTVIEEAKKELGPAIVKKAPETKEPIDVEAIFNKIASEPVDDIEDLLKEVK